MTTSGNKVTNLTASIQTCPLHPTTTHHSMVAEQKPPIVLALEGGIAVGKSALLSALRNSHIAHKYALFVVEEPVGEWQNVGGENLLELYYQQPDRYAFPFQLHCMHTRFQAMHHAMHQSHADNRQVLLILERSWFSDMECFATMHHRAGNIKNTELTLLRQHFDIGILNVPTIDGIVLLEVPLKVAMHRMRSRGRVGESTVTTKYQEDLRDIHDSWLNRAHIPYTRVDATAPFHQQPASPSALDEIVHHIDAFITQISGGSDKKKKKRSKRRQSNLITPCASIPISIPGPPVTCSQQLRTRSRAMSAPTKTIFESPHDGFRALTAPKPVALGNMALHLHGGLSDSDTDGISSADERHRGDDDDKNDEGGTTSSSDFFEFKFDDENGWAEFSQAVMPVPHPPQQQVDSSSTSNRSERSGFEEMHVQHLQCNDRRRVNSPGATTQRPNRNNGDCILQ